MDNPLTIKARKEIYQLIKINMPYDDRQGVCFYLYWYAEPVLPYEDILYYFPEFRAQLPEYAYIGGYWWPAGREGYYSRMAALDESIKLCY
jgi:hypothetical protein